MSKNRAQRPTPLSVRYREVEDLQFLAHRTEYVRRQEIEQSTGRRVAWSTSS
jgi:hypothetical protein